MVACCCLQLWMDHATSGAQPRWWCRWQVSSGMPLRPGWWRKKWQGMHTWWLRLQRLLHHCGGIEQGDDLTALEGVCQPSCEQRRRQLQTLRLSCNAAAFAPIRER